MSLFLGFGSRASEHRAASNVIMCVMYKCIIGLFAEEMNIVSRYIQSVISRCDILQIGEFDKLCPILKA